MLHVTTMASGRRTGLSEDCVDLLNLAAETRVRDSHPRLWATLFMIPSMARSVSLRASLG
jgi:hypothetical protein